MAWRKPTKADLAGTLSQKEIDLYRQSAAPSGGRGDPVADLLERTAEMVRGYCRANRSLRVSSVAGTIPESLVSPAMDYAAFDVLKRFPTPVSEPRQKARDAAVALFERVADGDFTPEDAEGEGDEESAPTVARPVFLDPTPPRLLD